MEFYNADYFMGKTLGDLAAYDGLQFTAFSVFLSEDPQDDILGEFVAEDLGLTGIVNTRPDLAKCTVVYTNNWRGQIVLRVAPPKEEGRV
jgi:hypothetical protein